MKKKICSFAAMTLGALLMSVGVYFFKIPNGFSTGGVSGIATVLGYVIPFLSPGSIMTIINLLMLLLGFLLLGKGTGVKTVYCSLVFSGLTWMWEYVFPLAGPLTDQPLLELIYAVMLTGLGSAVLFYDGASSGGTDILALILKKYTALDVGKALLCSDFLISASAFFVFGFRAGLFSLLGLFAKAFLVDSVIENMYVCKSFMIVTSNPAPIADYIIHTLHHSATTVDAVGEYSHGDKKIVFTLCKRVEAVRLKQKLREIDPQAFVIVQSTSEIIGRGFRSV